MGILRGPLLPLLWAALVGAWLGLLLAGPEYRPHTRDLDVGLSPALSLTLSSLGFLGIAYLHELAHFFTARAYGVDATIRLGHRLLIPVLETDVTNAWTLPPGPRIRIFLAGTAFNLALASTCGLFAAAEGFGYVHAPSLAAAARFVVFLNLVPLVFQLFVFARTDLYFVAQALLGERNLAGDARTHVRLRLRRLGLRIRGATTKPCPACAGTTFEGEPFCFRCGRALDVKDVNKYPVTGRRRRRLFAIGLFFTTAQVFGLTYVLTFGLTYLLRRAGNGVGRTVAALEAHDNLRAGEGLLTVLLAFAQLGLLLYFLGGRYVWRMLRNRRTLRGRRTAATEASP